MVVSVLLILLVGLPLLLLKVSETDSKEVVRDQPPDDTNHGGESKHSTVASTGSKLSDRNEHVSNRGDMDE